MSTTPRKAPLNSTMSSNTTPRRPPTTPQRSSSPTTRGTSSSNTLSTNGMAITSSAKSPTGVTRPTRASVRRPGQGTSNLNNTSTLNVSDDGSEDDARIENAALIDNLKRSLRTAELVSEDYQRQLSILQKNLDDVHHEQGKFEERLHESGRRIEELEIEKKEVSRQKRDMENIYESERITMMRDRDEQTAREAELKSSVQRLKETLAGREMRINADAERRMSRSGGHSRSSSADANGGFAPSSSIQRRDSSLQRGDSNRNSRLVTQKDMVIESLRLELADAQIKMVEMENMGGGRMQEMERTLLETRMTNARLMEDNESFQLLLGEKTLNGDFSKADFMQGPSLATGKSGLGSLAEELESAEGESENYRRLEAEAKSLRDQNKALTLYIEKIISRVLMHDNFETILDQKPEAFSGGSRNAPMDMQKDLPSPPPKDDEAAPSVLKRAMSAVAGPARRPRPISQIVNYTPPVQPPWEGLARKPRPMSQVMTSAPDYQPTVNEDQYTAPSIPLNRTHSVTQRNSSHRRTGSEKSELGNAATFVSQMYKGPPAGLAGPISPTLSPGGTAPRTSYFAPSSMIGNSTNNGSNSLAPRAPSGSRATSTSRPPSNTPATSERIGSGSNSVISRDSGEVPSPPRNSAGNTNYTGAVMTQSRLRPLRLVQENKEMETASGLRRGTTSTDDEAAKKRNNRGSWMGWFNKGKDEAGPRSVSAENIWE